MKDNKINAFTSHYSELPICLKRNATTVQILEKLLEVDQVSAYFKSLMLLFKCTFRLFVKIEKKTKRPVWKRQKSISGTQL